MVWINANKKSLSSLKRIKKRNGDEETHDLPNVEFVHDFLIFYITWEKTKLRYINVNKFGWKEKQSSIIHSPNI